MSSRVSLSIVSQALDTLTDEERAALRASRFHSAPAPHPDRRSRLAHPGGALATNKAAALAKFLKRKLEEDGAASLDPDLVERAVENAKATARRSGSSVGIRNVRHVDSFSDLDEGQDEGFQSKKLKHSGGTSQAGTKKDKKKRKKVHEGPSVEQVVSLKVKGKKKKSKKKKSH